MFDITRRTFLKGLLATTATTAVTISLSKPELIKILVDPSFNIPKGFEDVFKIVGYDFSSEWLDILGNMRHKTAKIVWNGHEFIDSKSPEGQKILKERRHA